MTLWFRVLAASLLLLSSAAQSQNIATGIVDDFEDATTMGWSHGSGSSPNPPVVIADGGNEGAGDAYLENTSTGGGGRGSKHVFLNEDQRWTGDYIAAGVNRIDFNVINFGPTEDLHVRIAILGVDFVCWASTDAIIVPPDSTWRSIHFMIDETAMTPQGGLSFAAIASDVVQIRVFSAVSPDNGCRGDAFVGTSGYDDFHTATDAADTDLDGVSDAVDNCMLLANPGQIDSDGDGFGNRCDPDFDNNGTVNLLDLAQFRSVFLTSAGDPNYDPDADLNGDNSVDLQDLAIVRAFFLQAPGP